MQYTELDAINVKHFKEDNRAGYKCKMCRSLTSLDDSISYHGVNLVCMDCYNRLKDIFNDDFMLNTLQQAGKELEDRYNKLMEV